MIESNYRVKINNATAMESLKWGCVFSYHMFHHHTYDNDNDNDNTNASNDGSGSSSHITNSNINNNNSVSEYIKTALSVVYQKRV